MNSKKLWLGILAMVLVFGMAFVGCDEPQAVKHINEVIGGIQVTTSGDFTQAEVDDIRAQIPLTGFADYVARLTIVKNGETIIDLDEDNKAIIFTNGMNFLADLKAGKDKAYEAQNPEPVPQSTVITGLFDTDSSATIKGEFTDTEWAEIPEIIKNTLNSRFDRSGVGIKNAYRNLFDWGDGVVITLEKNTDFDNYRIIRNDPTSIRINFSILNDAEALESALHNAILAIGNPAVPETAQIFPSVRYEFQKYYRHKLIT
jgi:hypothetical protein